MKAVYRRALLAVGVALSSFGTQATPILQSVSPTARDFVFGIGQEFAVGSPTGLADFTAPLAILGPVGTPASGCGALPAGVLTGTITLIERGTCAFAVKAENAFNSGAIGVLIFNHDLDPADTDAFEMNLASYPGTIPGPVFSTSLEVGEFLTGSALAGPTTVRMRVTAEDLIEAAVAEPDSIALVALGLLALGYSRQRKARSRESF